MCFIYLHINRLSISYIPRRPVYADRLPRSSWKRRLDIFFLDDGHLFLAAVSFFDFMRLQRTQYRMFMRKYNLIRVYTVHLMFIHTYRVLRKPLLTRYVIVSNDNIPNWYSVLYTIRFVLCNNCLFGNTFSTIYCILYTVSKTDIIRWLYIIIKSNLSEIKILRYGRYT